MARPPARELTERELQVMQVFWKHGELTAADVRRELARVGLRLAYTTVATLVRLVAEKGFLEQTSHERPFRYRPRRTQEEVSRRLLGDLLHRVFGGSRERLLLHLFEERRLTPAERELLQEILRTRG